MKVWITKYALANGYVTAMEAEEPPAYAPGMIVAAGQWNRRQFHGEGREWHRTPESALDCAEKMRAAKIASLRKSIAKLEGIKFEVEK